MNGCQIDKYRILKNTESNPSMVLEEKELWADIWWQEVYQSGALFRASAGRSITGDSI